MKLDPDTGKTVTTEAVSLLTYATELFTKYSGEKAFTMSHIQKRTSIMPRDILDATNTSETMKFLNEDIEQQVIQLEKDAKEEKERVEKK
jgi:hypothetical protein